MVSRRQEDNKDWCRVFSCLNIISCRHAMMLHTDCNMVTCRQEDNKDWCRVFSCLNIISCRPASYWLKHKDSLLNQVQNIYSIDEVCKPCHLFTGKLLVTDYAWLLLSRPRFLIASITLLLVINY